MADAQVLLVESDEELREFLEFLIASRFGAVVLPVPTVHEAVRALKQGGLKPVAVLSELEPKEGGLAALYDGVKACSLSPSWFICSSTPESSARLPEGLKVEGWIPRPYLLEALVRSMGRVLGARTEEGASGAALSTLLKPGALCRLRVSSLLRLGIAPCSILAQVSGKNTSRIFSKGDLILSGTLSRMRLRLDDVVFVLTEDSPLVASQMSRDLVSLLAQGAVDRDHYWELAPEIQESIHHFSQKLGFTPEVQTLTRRSVDAAMAYLETQRSKPEIASLLKKFQVSPLNYIPSHSILVAHVACGLAQKMGIGARPQLLRLCLASFLHDVTLSRQEIARVQKKADLLVETLNAKLTSDEIDSFTRHPEQAADLARGFTDFPSDVDRIVLEHHEWPNGEGFPKGLQPAELHPLSCVFQVAHHMVWFADTYPGGFEVDKFVESCVEDFGASPYAPCLSAVT